MTYIYGMFYRFGLIDVPDEVKEKMEKNEELQYESFEGYELPPRTQFSMHEETSSKY